jgi:hypothetical protein
VKGKNMKKYKLTSESKEYFGITLYRIEALKDFGGVSKGDKGGFIEKEENLSQEDNAWVSGNARVYGNAWVSGDARVYGDAWVSGNARVYGNAWVSGDAWVYGDAWVSGKLKLLAGYFFGVRYKKEEIKYVQVDEDYEVIYKGEAKFGEEAEEKSLSGKTVKVEIDGVSYEAVIK